MSSKITTNHGLNGSTIGDENSNGSTHLVEQLIKPLTVNRGDSMCSREGLRRDLYVKRAVLTPKEHSFLETLLIHGNEIEVELARKRLNDDELFPSLQDDLEEDDIDNTDGNANADGDGDGFGPNIQVGREISIHTQTDSLFPPSNESCTNSMKSSISARSAKNQKHMMTRKNSKLFGEMWRAHETGLGFSERSARRSLIRRTSGIINIQDDCSLVNGNNVPRNTSFLSTATTELLTQGGPVNRPGEDAIFRQSVDSIDSTFAPLISPSIPKVIRQIPLKTPLSPGLDSVQSSVPESKGRPAIPKPSIVARSESERPPRVPVPMPPPARMVRSISDRSTARRVSFHKGTHAFPGGAAASRRVSPRLLKRISARDSLVSPSEEILREYPADGNPGGAIFSSISTIESMPSQLSLPTEVQTDDKLDSSVRSYPSLQYGNPVEASINSVPGIRRAQRLASMDSTMSEQEEVTKTRQSHAWAAPDFDIDNNGSSIRTIQQKPVFFRQVSKTTGEGIEVTEFNQNESANKARIYSSMLSMASSVKTNQSFDDVSEKRESIFRGIPTSFSQDEAASNYFLGSSKLVFDQSHNAMASDTLAVPGVARSWEMDSVDDDRDDDFRDHDAWNILKVDYATGYGGDESLPFRILGTSVDDVSAHPHVLSPPLMESLQNFLPLSINEENFWMKYSLVRDGASMHTLLQHIRGTKYTILAIETADGEVFGAFCGEAWRKNWNYFGTGESFLWRMRQKRTTHSKSIIDQAQLESELDVYPWVGENSCIQLCTHDKIAVGGGQSDENGRTNYGFGLSLERDLMKGTSSNCATFSSPPLASEHPDGSPFEIMNLEVWTLTPCSSVEEADRLELGKLFLQMHTRQ